jgi:hypothetical protein
VKERFEIDYRQQQVRRTRRGGPPVRWTGFSRFGVATAVSTIVVVAGVFMLVV